MRKILSLFLILALSLCPLSWSEITSIKENKGLQRLQEDRIEDGSHSIFSNVYITDEGNIRNVKGRTKLNTTALTDTTVNMLCYYENQTGTTKKLILRDSDEIVTYDTDGTNRIVIASSLANERGDCVQIGDSLYMNSATTGLYKWTGSGSATAITAVSSPSAQDFSPTTTTGGLTAGNDAILTHLITSSSDYFVSGGTCSQYPVYVAEVSVNNLACDGLVSFRKACALYSNYKYKTTWYNSQWGIESEASSSDTCSLRGANTVSTSGIDCFPSYSDSACTSSSTLLCSDSIITVSGRQTSCQATISGSESSPFNKTCIYRTTASGADYFLVGCQPSSESTFLDGKPDVSLDRPLDTTIDTITPPSFRYIAEYKGTIFTGESTTINFSRLPALALTNGDKYWLATDTLEATTKKPITGLHNTANSLLVFSSNKVAEISGFGVDSFRNRVLFEQIGAISDETIETDNNGDVIFFAGTAGVYKLRTGQSPTDDLTGTVIDQPNTSTVRISSPFLDSVFRGDDSLIDLNPSDYTLAHAYYDLDNDFYWLFIDEHAFMFNNKSNQWSYIPATKMRGSVYVKSSSQVGYGILIDNLGFMYKNWYGYVNGVTSGTVTGKPTSSTNSTLVDSTATFNTTNDGLKGAWVYLENVNGEWRQIQSNTATQITVSPDWTVNPVSSDDYYIGYIVPRFRTKQYQVVQPPLRAKIENLYITHNKSDSEQTIELTSYENKSSIANNLKEIDMSESFVDKRSIPMGAGKYFYQWELKTFIYNTSDTINPPVEIQNYAIDWEELEEF